MTRYNEIDLSRIRTYSATDRSSTVRAEEEAKPPHEGMTMGQFLKSLPPILKAKELEAVAQAVVDARERNKPIIMMLGGHVIKTGCRPILADLAERGFVTHFASSGAAAIHDTELACFNHTSEDVSEQLEDGSFGMAADTAAVINGAAVRAQRQGEGFGEALGAMLLDTDADIHQRSLLAKCYHLNIPYTLHVALGTDIVHQHASAKGAAIGEASLRDFRILCHSVSRLGDGGVVLNVGSAVILPEVFLKCLAVARNLASDVSGFVTANFDMIQHYRPTVNVVQRPVLSEGVGYSITGHHEIMIPLLAAAIHEAAA
ncbi:MAG: hypothetical protein V3S89_03870 [Desulfobacterales bacterium]